MGCYDGIKKLLGGKSLQPKRRGSVWGTGSELLVLCPPNFLLQLWSHPDSAFIHDSPLSIKSPVLDKGGIFSTLRSSPAQCLLYSGIKDSFPWILVLQNSLSPWGRVGLTFRKSGKLGRT